MVDQPVDGSHPIHCAFCGQTPDHVNAMISGPNGIYICDECISVCAEAMITDLSFRGLESDALNSIIKSHEEMFAPGNSQESSSDLPLQNLPTPRELYNQLSEHVVGQENAKRALAVAVYNHYKRISLGESARNNVEIAKSNILLLGPTGSGKTLLAQTLARTLVPFAIADATTLTEAGYVGEDVENILLKLITAADFDIERAEIGIITPMKLTRLRVRRKTSLLRATFRVKVFSRLCLKLLRALKLLVPPQGGRKHPQQELIHIDTTNILLFLVAPLLDCLILLPSVLVKRALVLVLKCLSLSVRQTRNCLRKSFLKDLHKFGMIPEFVGRIPVVTSLKELSKEDLVRVLTEPKNALVKQYSLMFEYEDSELVFEPEALEAIAEQAIEHQTGARGLRSICEAALMDVMYELPDHEGRTKVVIKRSDIEGSTKPEIIQVEVEPSKKRKKPAKENVE